MRTRMKSFGGGERAGHDSSEFYNRSMYADADESDEPYIENAIADEHINAVFLKSSEQMDELPDNSVHLAITSPPYNVGKDYDENLTFEDYRDMLKRIWKECYRVLVIGGRICVNIGGIGRKPYIPLHLFLAMDLLDIGFFMRGDIIWDKGGTAGSSTAWGTWLSAENPVLRGVHEYILVFCKGRYVRDKSESTIGRDEFIEYTKSVWRMPTASAIRTGHPAPFPKALPMRLIQLYSFKDDIVLDPFVGSGTTAIASKELGRRYIGYDIEPEYVKIANDQLRQEMLLF